MSFLLNPNSVIRVYIVYCLVLQFCFLMTVFNKFCYTFVAEPPSMGTVVVNVIWKLIQKVWTSEYLAFLFIQDINPFPNKPLCVCNTSLLKTLWEKEKLLVTSNFYFSHSVSLSFEELSSIFMPPYRIIGGILIYHCLSVRPSICMSVCLSVCLHKLNMKTKHFPITPKLI